MTRVTFTEVSRLSRFLKFCDISAYTTGSQNVGRAPTGDEFFFFVCERHLF
jgi:hypothetical protein